MNLNHNCLKNANWVAPATITRRANCRKTNTT